MAKTINEVYHFFEDDDYELASKSRCEEYFETLQNYAIDGDSGAQFTICVMYLAGTYVEQNIDLAEKWLAKLLKAINSHKYHTDIKECSDVNEMIETTYVAAGKIYTALEDYKKSE